MGADAGVVLPARPRPADPAPLPGPGADAGPAAGDAAPAPGAHRGTARLGAADGGITPHIATRFTPDPAPSPAVTAADRRGRAPSVPSSPAPVVGSAPAAGALDARALLEIRADAALIAGELDRASPGVTLITVLLNRWHGRDTALRGGSPHVDALLGDLQQHTYQETVGRTVLGGDHNALDALWLLADTPTRQAGILGLVLRSSRRFGGHRPGPGQRAWWNWDGRTADTLRAELLAGHYPAVEQGLDDTSSLDRDDVAVSLMEFLRDDQVARVAASADGRQTLSRLYDELTTGRAGSDELVQAERILAHIAATLATDGAYDAAATSGQTMIFPYRETGWTVGLLGLGAPAVHIEARRSGAGTVWVRLPGRVLAHPAYADEVRTLPRGVFAPLQPGIEIDEGTVVGVRLHDEGTTRYAPALILVMIANLGAAKAFEMMGQAVAAGLAAAPGSAGVAAAGATRLAQGVRYADALVTAAGAVSQILREHRGWIITTFRSGRDVVDILELVDSVVAHLGYARAVTSVPGLAVSLRSRLSRLRSEAASRAAALTAAERRVTDRLAERGGDLLRELETARQGAARPTGTPTGGGVPVGGGSGGGVVAMTPVVRDTAGGGAAVDLVPTWLGPTVDAPPVPPARPVPADPVEAALAAMPRHTPAGDVAGSWQAYLNPLRTDEMELPAPAGAAERPVRAPAPRGPELPLYLPGRLPLPERLELPGGEAPQAPHELPGVQDPCDVMELGRWTRADHAAAEAEWDRFAPSEYWIDMKGAPQSSATVEYGWKRNSDWFWRTFHARFGDLLSPDNRAWTKAGLAPIVDAEWIRLFPDHKPFEGDFLVHHHIEKGPLAAAVPRRFHQIFHGPLHYLRVTTRRRSRR
jgi:hypothetical protein